METVPLGLHFQNLSQETGISLVSGLWKVQALSSLWPADFAPMVSHLALS